jgi:hypothetical protein
MRSEAVKQAYALVHPLSPSLHPSYQEDMMATSHSPLAPNPVTDIDGPEVFPSINPIEDLGAGVPVGEEGNIEVDEDDAIP